MHTVTHKQMYIYFSKKTTRYIFHNISCSLFTIWDILNNQPLMLYDKGGSNLVTVVSISSRQSSQTTRSNFKVTS